MEIKLKTAFDEIKTFYQPILCIEKLEWTSNRLYWNYQKVLSITFMWNSNPYYIIDNEENRKELSNNAYNI